MSKILIIEDDPIISTLILRLLTAEEYEAIVARQGRSGLDLARNEQPDLVLCDIMMPEMDGYEVLEQLRQDPETAGIPFIFLTAKSDRSEQRLGMELGADDYLAKPFTRDELLEAIAARLEKKTSVTQPYLEELKRATENLTQLAFCDPLTNLPNRIQLYHWLQSTLNRARQKRQTVVVLALGLRRLPAVVPVPSLPVETILQAAANRLTQSLKPTHPIARISPDEFGIVFGDLSSYEDATQLAHEVLELVSQPYSIEGHLLTMQPYVGIALFPSHGETPHELIQRAELAMYRVKDKDADHPLKNELPLLSDVAAIEQLGHESGAVLKHNEFYLDYQPQIHLSTRRIIGVEALVRWSHPEQGILYPDQFLAIAEAQGALVSLSDWILRTACTAACNWQSIYQRPIRVSVNLTSSYFRDSITSEGVSPAIASLTQILQDTRLDPGLLALDVNEAAVMQAGNLSQKTLDQLNQLGVKLFLDDFGTGFSCIASLKYLSLEGLKIDRTFIKEIAVDSDAAAIVRAIIAIGHNLQLKVFAEGVETEEQFTLLKQWGCDAARGYFFSPPVSDTQISHLLSNENS